MKYKFYIIFFIACITILYACSENVLKPMAYIKWIEDPLNGLKISKTINELSFEVQYKPYDYIIARELKKDRIKREEYEKIVKEIEGMQYYNFVIRVKDESGSVLKYKTSGEEEYNERLNYFLFNAQNDIYLIEDNDTLKCELYHFERNFGLAPYNTILCAFYEGTSIDKKSLQDKVFVFNDKTFGYGLIQLPLAASSLRNIPSLIID